MDAISSWCGTDPCRRTSPSICCSKCGQLPKLQSSAVHIHPTRDERTVGSRQRMLVYGPNRRYGSWSLGHHDRNVTSGTAYFYNSDNWNEKSRLLNIDGHWWLSGGDCDTISWDIWTLFVRCLTLKPFHSFLCLLLIIFMKTSLNIFLNKAYVGEGM